MPISGKRGHICILTVAAKAIEDKKIEKVVRMLHSLKKCYLNARVPYGNGADKGTLLHVAAYNGNIEAIDMLIQCGLDKTIKTKLGLTFLQVNVASSNNPLTLLNQR